MSGDDADARRRALERSLTGRFWLRFHMSLMLGVAFAAGALANHMLIGWSLHHAALRWLGALAVAYAAFFIVMRLWLAYVGARPLCGIDLGNALDFSGSGGSGGGGAGVDVGSSASKGIGAGGRFGGGGASSAFDSTAPQASVVSSGSGSSGSGASRGGFGLDLGDDGKFIILVLITLAICAALVGGAAYLLVAAPHLLPDIAFGAALTHGFGHGVRKASADPGWTGSVLAATWKPFVAVTTTIVIAGFAFEHYFPGVHTLGEAWRRYV